MLRQRLDHHVEVGTHRLLQLRCHKHANRGQGGVVIPPALKIAFLSYAEVAIADSHRTIESSGLVLFGCVKAQHRVDDAFAFLGRESRVLCVVADHTIACHHCLVSALGALRRRRGVLPVLVGLRHTLADCLGVALPHDLRVVQLWLLEAYLALRQWLLTF